MDFHATKERPVFPFGPLYPGDSITMKFFVAYLLRSDKVVELKSMNWPLGKGVTRMPKPGAHPSPVAAFHAYCSAFRNVGFDRFPMVYMEDACLELGSVLPLLGR